MAEQKIPDKSHNNSADDYVQIFLLNVSIHKGIGLAKADGPFGKSDPYCRVSGFGQSFTTATQLKTLDPVWNETTRFTFFDDPGSLKFEVFDWDKGTQDDPLGDVDLPVTDLFKPGSLGFEGNLTLKNVKKGQIHVKVTGRKLLPVRMENEAQRLDDLNERQKIEMSEKNGTIQGLSSQNQSLENDNDGLKKSIDSLNNEKNGKESEVDTLSSNKADTQGKLDGLTSQLSDLNETAEKSEKEATNAAATLARTNEQESDALDDEDRLRTEMAEQESLLKEKESELQKLDEDLEEARRKPANRPKSPIARMTGGGSGGSSGKTANDSTGPTKRTNDGENNDGKSGSSLGGGESGDDEEGGCCKCLVQ